MNRNQISLVQQSFAQVAPISSTAADIFYTRLFEIAPELRPMFRNDMGAQGEKLMATLGAVVGGLSRLDDIVPVAQELALRHVDYGVTAEHYAPVGRALIYTLETGLGDAFTDELRLAWIAAYDLLAGAMIEAAYTGSGDRPTAVH